MKSLILTGKLATYDEYVYPLHRLREVGQVDVATPGMETVYGELKGFGGALVHAGPIVPTCDIPPAHPHFEYPWDLLLLPGGAKAMEYLRQDKNLLKLIACFHMNGGVIAAICHAAQLLISGGLCNGRTIAGYYSIEDDIVNAGGTYSREPVSCERIVTAAHYKDMAEWMKLILIACQR